MVTKPEKYTRDFVLLELNEMLKEVNNDLGIFFINQLFENRSYSRQRYSEWAEKFKDDDEISDTIKKLEDQLENRLVVGGLTSALNPAITIFTLKNKHNWRDKTEVDNTHEIKGTLVEFIDARQDKDTDTD